MPLKIGVSYWGQPRMIPHTFDNFTTTILDNKNEFHILYSTWTTENTDEFERLFSDISSNTCSNVYIKKYDCPNIKEMENYKNLFEKYTMDPSSPNKTLEHYLLGLYIKKESANTIIEYENSKNIKFDIIISLRTDTKIYNGDIRTHYNMIANNSIANKIFVAHEPQYDIYYKGALPDVIIIGKNVDIVKALHHLDVVEKTLVTNTNFFHPETSFNKSISELGLFTNKLSFSAFPKQN